MAREGVWVCVVNCVMRVGKVEGVSPAFQGESRLHVAVFTVPVEVVVAPYDDGVFAGACFVYPERECGKGMPGRVRGVCIVFAKVLVLCLPH